MSKDPGMASPLFLFLVRGQTGKTTRRYYLCSHRTSMSLLLTSEDMVNLTGQLEIKHSTQSAEMWFRFLKLL